MPELAEVEFFRRRWHEAGAGQIVRAARVLARSRVYRGLAREFRGGANALARALAGRRFAESGTHGKQMWFGFTERNAKRGADALWVGVHLGMTGELLVEHGGYAPAKYDALVLELERCTLVFNDPRQFGRVHAWLGPEGTRPPWLRDLPPVVTAPEFSAEAVRDYLARHARAPLKAVLLQQERFPGIGNWMADEILWRAGLHPALPAGRAARLANRLHAAVREVAEDALRVIAGAGGPLPPDHNANIPDTWLFLHRWRDGGRCPHTGRPLRRAVIGGRATCWSPARQRAPRFTKEFEQKETKPTKKHPKSKTHRSSQST